MAAEEILEQWKALPNGAPQVPEEVSGSDSFGWQIAGRRLHTT